MVRPWYARQRDVRAQRSEQLRDPITRTELVVLALHDENRLIGLREERVIVTIHVDRQAEAKNRDHALVVHSDREPDQGSKRKATRQERQLGVFRLEPVERRLEVGPLCEPFIVAPRARAHATEVEP